MANEFGRAEADRECPVSLEVLGELYRADAETLAERLPEFTEEKRIRLALFCYSKAHLRDLALAIAASCDAEKLTEAAGTIGQVLAAQSRSKRLTFGKEPAAPEPKPKVKISLGGTKR